MNIDPLAEQYFKTTPYAYVGNSPIVAFDPDGKKILFVNGYYNGLVGWLIGSSSGGEQYWGKGFAGAAQDFFGDYSKIGSSNFIDGSSMFGGDSSGSDRKSAGYEYAKNNYSTLIEDLGEDETFKLVTHSEGSAFGAGVAEYLMLKGHDVESIVHLSADEADEFSTPFIGPNTFQLGYAGDWVSGNKELDNTSVFAVIDKFESSSDKFQFAHGSTKGAGVFDELKSILKAIAKNGSSFAKITETKDGIKIDILRYKGNRNDEDDE